MKYKEYRQLSHEMRKLSDINKVARKRGLDNELLHVIYTQKVVRDVIKRYYKVQKKAPKMLHQWKSGRSFVRIADEQDFPPSLIAMMILKQNKIPRKQAWRFLNDPNEIKDARLRKEIIIANKADGVYSPAGLQRQADRGRWGENKLRKWLNVNNIPHQTESDLRGKYQKTPDFLLDEPLEWNGEEKFWIESKATFGDPIEIKKHLRRQLAPYVSLFGEGLVVYWFGYIDDLRVNIPEEISLANGSHFDGLME